MPFAADSKESQRKRRLLLSTFPFFPLHEFDHSEFEMEGGKTPLKTQPNPEVQDGNFTNFIGELKQRFGYEKITLVALRKRIGFE